jgi:DNA-binding CsgD family transcriptional regulator
LSKSFLVALSLADSNKYKRIVLYKNTINLDVAQQGEIGIERQPVCGDGSPNNKYPQYGAEANIVHTIRQHSKRFTSDEIPSLIAEYKNGATVYELADKYGCHRNTISNTLKRNGVIVTIEKITDPGQLDGLMRLYKNGFTALQIAEKLDLGKTTVRRYLREGGVMMRTRWDYARR